MTKNIFLLFVLFTLGMKPTKAQSLSHSEQLEKTLSYWSSTMEQVRVENAANREEFDIFNRFYAHTIDSIHIEFLHKVNTHDLELNSAKQYMIARKSFFTELFKNFRNTELSYPTSVSEYKTEHRPRLGGDSCYTNCYNTGFDNGTFSGWYGYYAVNNSGTAGFTITSITGGYLGAVTQAANDPFTGTYQMHITSGTLTDVFLNTYSTYSMPQVSPYGGNHSVMLGDSSRNGQGVAILSQSFLVSSTTPSLNIQYSLFLEDPAGHSYYEQPFFSAVILDQNGDTIPTCGEFMISAQHPNNSGFKGIYYTLEGDSVYWKPWTVSNINLTKYIGQCVTVIFQVFDCSLGGHFGYAYVDASCSPLNVLTSSPSFCGQDSILLTAPFGSTSYLWTGPRNGIISNPDLQNIWADSSGTYSVVCTPSTGPSCADTLTITITKSTGPVPHPDFNADSVCLGQPVQFINTSLPANGKFSWDFYNVGIYNLTDTNNFNPTWSYSSPGTYQVKLHEVYNGCGNDTVISVVVSPYPTADFTISGACINTPVSFTNTSTGGTKYSWNFGNPTSGPLDSSSVFSPAHTYTAAATYTVTLIVTNSSNCTDSIQKSIVISALPHPIIRGHDSICPGTRDTLSVTGGTTYIWTNNGSTNSSISGIPTITTTYTVEAFNGFCEHDTTFTISIIPAPTATIIASKDSVCSGDSLTLEASGGSSYRWSPGGSTSSKIHINPTTTSNTFKLYSYGGVCVDSASITIGIKTPISALLSSSADSICMGDTVNLTATAIGGSATFKWSTGATSSVISATPSTTTTYTVSVYGACDSVIDVITITVNVCSGINEILNHNQFAIYPNPSDGVFTLQSSIINGQWTVGIYNELGQQVFTKTGTGKINEQLNLESLASGIYSVRLQTTNGITVKKLVLMRK